MLEISGIGQMINHTQCLSDNLDNIYTQKLMSIGCHSQSTMYVDKHKCIVNNMV